MDKDASLANIKTPVSILTEYALQMGYIPKFDLIFSQVGVHNPTFVFNVTVGDDQAAGKGRSKQEAKHDAARKMLDQLGILKDESYKKDAEQLIVPHENNIAYNAVGALLDYCKKNMYPEPTYDSLADSGPAHAKIFLIKCCVSQQSKMGEARTKKQAKQLAAHNMLMQLQMEAGDKPMAVALPRSPSYDALNEAGTLPNPTPVFQPQALLYSNFCDAYIGIHEKSETISCIIQNQDVIKEDNALEYVKKIAGELLVSLLVKRVSNNDVIEVKLTDGSDEVVETEGEPSEENPKIIFMSLELNPPILSMGNSIKDASLNLLRHIKILCC